MLEVENVLLIPKKMVRFSSLGLSSIFEVQNELLITSKMAKLPSLRVE